MSDEQKQPESPETWTMPEPIFRSTEGHTPAGIHATVPADESTTAPGFHQATTLETEGLQPEPDIHQAKTIETEGLPAEPDFHEAKTVETEGLPPATAKVKAAPVKPKKRGCAKTFLFTVGLIGLGIAAVVIALVYFLFYYRPADTVTF
ncbi:MAG TPA: hypothetical protein PLL77_07215 [Pyrinomonadaceae bacterium]|nr:hypothetical protein [Pyrinomonadaceae bacterium]